MSGGRFAPPLLLLLLISPAAGAQTASLVLDIDTTSEVVNAALPQSFVALGGRVVFTAGDPSANLEPWVTDGRPQGTFFLREDSLRSRDGSVQ